MKIERLRELTNIEQSGGGKGLTLTTTVTAYDNGQVYLDNMPMNGTEPDDGWVIAIEVFAQQIRELKRRCAERQRQQVA